MNVLAILGIVLFLAFLTESMVEYFVGGLADHIPAIEPYKWLTIYVSAVFGVVASFIYRLDIVSLLSQFLQVQFAVTTFGIVITGLVIGRGANFVHDIWQKFFVKPTE